MQLPDGNPDVETTEESPEAAGETSSSQPPPSSALPAAAPAPVLGASTDSDISASTSEPSVDAAAIIGDAEVRL